MESIQQQLDVVSRKVDALQVVIEQLNAKLSAVLSSDRALSPGQPLSGVGPMSPSAQGAALKHKDVLLDGSHPHLEPRTGNRVLTPELQIQRLTAQLTAAYNRIAVLEEQLLAQRVH